MRQSRWFFCMVWVGAGMLFAGTTVEAFQEQVSSIAPDRTEIAARWAGYSPIPGGITPEVKTDGLPRVRSTFYEARQVRKLIENFGETLDCEPIETTVRYDETAAHPRSPGSQRSDLDGLLRDLRLQRTFETSA